LKENLQLWRKKLINIIIIFNEISPVKLQMHWSNYRWNKPLRVTSIRLFDYSEIPYHLSKIDLATAVCCKEPGNNGDYRHF